MPAGSPALNPITRTTINSEEQKYARTSLGLARHLPGQAVRDSSDR